MRPNDNCRVLEGGKNGVSRRRGAIYLVVNRGRAPMSRSVRFHEFGGPEVLRIEDVVIPEPGPDEVRLRIRAIGLNRGEILMRSGKAATRATLPARIGVEAAGVIEALGSDVKGLAVGE